MYEGGYIGLVIRGEVGSTKAGEGSLEDKWAPGKQGEGKC